MNWKMTIKEDNPNIIRRRTMFCFLPKIGSDLRWHWLETITRWEQVDSLGIWVLDEKTGRVIFPFSGELGATSHRLIEGPEN